MVAAWLRGNDANVRWDVMRLWRLRFRCSSLARLVFLFQVALHLAERGLFEERDDEANVREDDGRLPR